MIRTFKKIIWKIYENSPLFIRYPILFRLSKGHWPHLLFPKDYSDYIARDNFWGRHNRHAYLADKLEVRKYVESRGLGNILVPLLGYWDDASKVDFELLPNQFAIKCNHSCAMNIICYDKSKLDIEATREQLDEWMRTRHPVFFEQHYNHIKPMIFAEALIPSNKNVFFPSDYKIHCAHGKPIYIQYCFDRTGSDAGRRIIYDTNWKNLHYVIEDSHYAEIEMPRPKHLEIMLDNAKILSQGLDYARIDFYDTDAGVLFGEITLTPMGGWLHYFKQEALNLMGKEIRNGKQ